MSGGGASPVPGTARTFGERLRAAVAERGPLVVGVDPHASLLAQWGLADDADGLRAFARTVLDACAAHACALKPQSAFFERHGSRGITVLEELLGAARERGVLTILDVKRGDIGSTMGGYADAYLRPGAPLEADAVTVSPYLGFGSLAPALELAAQHGKGVFVLALTSNPDGPEVQHAARAHVPAADAAPAKGSPAGSGGTDASSVARTMADHARAANLAEIAQAGLDPAQAWGSTGLVIGATVGEALRELGIVVAATRAPVLAPGYGAQGAGPEDRAAVFGAAADRVLVSLSRGVLSAGPDPQALSTRAEELAAAYAL
ncbi:orotidine-5'-phosphate decarboxylase [Brachybacterium kimchii]|uniref:Orotidine 5'-phosphate decarboxylase n=1 Tax=Brachybacterium kimchii TaxID=2942909 RepID=A0ABY4N8I7_9MICO|nr:orotidine-5'-phosphate decarboxylase [Brachybacterium kimchii]UQN30876.1 orotidine-5'-phosphate decarboxylase [Brachybacterium kimchii]